MARLFFEGALYERRGDESVLDALLRGGADVAFSCRKGSCHTCLLRAVAGEPGEAAQRGLRSALRESGHFLPCVCRPPGDLELARADPAQVEVMATLVARERLSPTVVRLRLEPHYAMTWRPGQFVNLRRADGLARSYSIASVAAHDYFLELHVKREDRDGLSRWIHEGLAEGDEVALQGPYGVCTWDTALAERELVLVAAGTGLAPLVGIARDALLGGQRAPIWLYHGARTLEELYLDPELRALAASSGGLLRYVGCIGEPPPEGDGDASHLIQGRPLDVAFAAHADASHNVVFLAGRPEHVYDGRCRAVLAGVARERIFADPFELSETIVPDDKRKVDETAPDPELWAALGHGVGLRAILESFYGLVFADPRLAPFFHGVTRERAIDKQYEFLRDMFGGTRDYLGLRPFNAHHWMVISDELFDYREALFESVLRRHGLPEPMIRRWEAFHERFRRELVKSRARGRIVDGTEVVHAGFSEERVEIGTLCDGCTAEIAAGEVGRMHRRTGQFFCTACSAVAVD